MFDILKFFRGEQKDSKDIAKDRLKLVLVSDRNNCSPELLEQIKEAFIKSIEAYVDIDIDNLDIQITKDFEDNNSGKPALVANIPIKSIKRKSKPND